MDTAHNDIKVKIEALDEKTEVKTEVKCNIKPSLQTPEPEGKPGAAAQGSEDIDVPETTEAAVDAGIKAPKAAKVETAPKAEEDGDGDCGDADGGEQEEIGSAKGDGGK